MSDLAEISRRARRRVPQLPRPRGGVRRARRPTRHRPDRGPAAFVVSDGRAWAVLRTPRTSPVDAAVLHEVLLPAWGVADEQVGYHHSLDQALHTTARQPGRRGRRAPADGRAGDGDRRARSPDAPQVDVVRPQAADGCRDARPARRLSPPAAAVELSRRPARPPDGPHRARRAPQHLDLQPGAGTLPGTVEPAAQRPAHLDRVADLPARDAAAAPRAPGGAVDPVRGLASSPRVIGVRARGTDSRNVVIDRPAGQLSLDAAPRTPGRAARPCCPRPSARQRGGLSAHPDHLRAQPRAGAGAGRCGDRGPRRLGTARPRSGDARGDGRDRLAVSRGRAGPRARRPAPRRR